MLALLFFERWNLQSKEKSIIIAAAKINYYHQLKHPADIIVGQKVSRIGNKSFDISSGIFIKDLSQLVATSIITCVCFNYNENKSVSVYSEIKADYK